MNKIKKFVILSCTTAMLLSATPVFASEVSTEDLLARIEALEARVAALEGSGAVSEDNTGATAEALNPGIYTAGRDIEAGTLTLTITSGKMSWSLYKNAEEKEKWTATSWGYIQAEDYVDENNSNNSNTITIGFEKGMVLSVGEASDNGISTLTYSIKPFLAEE